MPVFIADPSHALLKLQNVNMGTLEHTSSGKEMTFAKITSKQQELRKSFGFTWSIQHIKFSTDSL